MTEYFSLDLYVLYVGTSLKALRDNEAVSFANLVAWYNYSGYMCAIEDMSVARVAHQNTISADGWDLNS
jgi:hypothetical protein